MSVEARGILPPLPQLAERLTQSLRPHGPQLVSEAGDGAQPPFEVPAMSVAGRDQRSATDVRAVLDEGVGAGLEDPSSAVLAQAGWVGAPAFTSPALPQDGISGPAEQKRTSPPPPVSGEDQRLRPILSSPTEPAPREQARSQAGLDACRVSAREAGAPMIADKAQLTGPPEAALPASAREGTSTMKDVRLPQGGGGQTGQDLARLAALAPRQDTVQRQGGPGTVRFRSPRGRLAALATGVVPSAAGSLQGAEAAQRTLSRWREFRVKEARGGSGAPSGEARTDALSRVRGPESRHSPGMEGAGLWQGPALGEAHAPATGLVLSRLASGASTGRMKAAADLGRLLEQVRGRVERLQLEGGGRVELRLDPADLGSLDLHLEKEGSGWRLEIVASRAETAQELLRQAKDLQEQLARAGLRLDELRLGEAQPTRLGSAPPSREGQGGQLGQGRDSRKGEGETRQDAEALDGDGEGVPRRQEDFASRLGKLIRTQSRKGRPS